MPGHDVNKFEGGRGGGFGEWYLSNPQKCESQIKGNYANGAY